MVSGKHRDWCALSLTHTSVACRSCPNCQHKLPESEYPSRYRCFCHKVIEPEPDPWLPPHSCGQTCGRQRTTCPHACVERCHAGACPPCAQMLRASCYCEKQTVMKRCGLHQFSCGDVCGRMLPCGHRCPLICHTGPCPPCGVRVSAACACGRQQRTVACAERVWHCTQPCGALLDCGQHRCALICHDRARTPCGPCELAGPRRCFCGKTSHALACTDPTPSCGDVCERLLPCGVHKCVRRCHEGPCGACDAMVTAACRCGRHRKQQKCGTELVRPLHAQA